MAKTLLRGDNGEITHKLYTIHQGFKVYLTIEDSDRIHKVKGEDVANYYNGEDYTELENLKEDMASIITGNIDPKVIALNIARHASVIKDEVLEIPM